MTTAALTAGCALLAFSPALALLLIVTYSKAQLIIVVTTSAFSYLLSTVISSLLWLPVPDSLRSNPYLLIPPSVVAQLLARTGFVWMYHKVEHAVEKSVRRFERAHAQEERQRQQLQQQQANGAGTDGPSSTAASTAAASADSPPPVSESAKLRLALNDWSSALAAGTGFGGMHGVMLYGTLLASESGNLGTLYQPSCSVMPSLVNSATMAFLFSILDIIWMLFTFYGMRRRRVDAVEIVNDNNGGGAISFAPTGGGGGFCRVPNSKRGGNIALILTVVTHLGAAFATMPNSYDDGCLVALPALAGVTAVTGLMFWYGISGHYLPDAQRRRIWERTASMAAEQAGGGGRYED